MTHPSPSRGRAAASSVPPAGVTISGTGMAMPSRRVTNDDLSRLVDTNDQWITQRTGISQRFVAENGQTTASLGTAAMRQALSNARLEPDDLDLLICATMTPDMICPGTGCQIVAELGAVPCGAMDVNLACTGFVAGLNIAHNFVRTGLYRHVAVVGAERLSSIVNWEDRRTCVLFGDGAGAAIVSATDNPQQGCLYQTMNSDGTRWGDLYCPRTERQIADPAVFSGKLDTLQMNGREVYKFAVTKFQNLIKDAMDACELSAAEVSMVIPHQSNARIIESAREKLGLSEQQVYMNLNRYGNTSAASAAICLHEAMEQGRIKPGDRVIFVAFGGGLTWASSVWRM